MSLLYVYGRGPVPADVMLIGERPGEEESRRGYPFCGKSGKELDRYLLEGGIHRDDMYCTNLCKDFLKGNPDPTPDEIRRDEHFLIEELKTVRPKFIGLVGRFAARHFLGEDLEMESSHGLPFLQTYRCLMPVYHPSFGLHSPGMTPLIWDDFQQFCKMVKGELDLTPITDRYYNPEYKLLIDDFPVFESDLPLYVDTEGSVEHPWGLSFTQWPGKAWVVLASNKFALKVLAKLIREYSLLVVLHNALHDIGVLRAMKIEGFQFTDTMVKSYHLCLFPQGLKPLSRRLCGMVQDDYEDVIGEADKEKKIQWLVEAWQWVNNRWPEESKTPSSRRTPKGSGRRSKRTSPASVQNSSVSLAHSRVPLLTTSR